MFSLESFRKEHETDTVEVVVSGRKFEILLPKNLLKFIDAHDVLHEFPLWAKIWQASWVLAGYLAEMPVAAGKRFLEIGAGVGLVSIVAACSGHRITMTELNPDALQFARANALINGCPNLKILALDWNRPRLQNQFDYIVASEISYRKEDLQPLLGLFKNYLKPGGEVILAGEMRGLSKEFYRSLETVFQIRVQKKILRSGSETTNIFLFRMALKD
jgi:predicted nicotinamide N-methyase